MKRRTFLTAVVCAATASLLFAVAAAADPPPDPRLEKVFADWQKRRERIKTVRYRASGEHVLPKGSFGDPRTGVLLGPDSPPHDISWPKHIVLLLDFTTNRHRLQEEEAPYSQEKEKFIPRRTTTVFDSKELWTLADRPAGAPPDPAAPDAFEVSGNMRGQAFPSVYWPFFLGHGIVALTTEAHILPGRLKVIPESEVYEIQGEGIYENRRCLVLRTGATEFGAVGFDELWLDSALESAVVRQVQYVDGNIAMDMQIDYQQTRVGWLPQSWTIAYLRAGGKAAAMERMNVEEVQIDPSVSDADFHVDLTPGMIVKRFFVGGSPDQTTMPNPTPGPVFQIEGNGSWKEIARGEGEQSQWFSNPWMWVGFAIALVAAAGAGLWWRTKHRRAA